MTGQLRTHGGGGPIAVCTVCRVQAVGPCARCHAPLCGDCCVITEGGAKKWAICPNCAAGGTSLASGWGNLLAWILVPIGILAALVALLNAFAN